MSPTPHRGDQRRFKSSKGIRQQSTTWATTAPFFDLVRRLGELARNHCNRTRPGYNPNRQHHFPRFPLRPDCGVVSPRNALHSTISPRSVNCQRNIKQAFTSRAEVEEARRLACEDHNYTVTRTPACQLQPQNPQPRVGPMRVLQPVFSPQFSCRSAENLQRRPQRGCSLSAASGRGTAGVRSSEGLAYNFVSLLSGKGNPAGRRPRRNALFLFYTSPPRGCAPRMISRSFAPGMWPELHRCRCRCAGSAPPSADLRHDHWVGMMN